MVQYLYFKPGMPGSKYKSSDDVVGSALSPYLPAVVLYYCTFQSTIRLKNVLFVVFMYYLCENYYKSIIVQYYIANCVSWVPRLTLLGL